MGNNEIFKKIAAALFFFLGLYLLIMLVFTIGKDKGITEEKFQLRVLFHQVGGLMEGAPTRLSGVTVGSVASIDFLDEEVDGRHVKVTINMFEKYRRQLNRKVRIGIRTEGVLGEKLVEITPIKAEGKVDLNELIIGEDPLDIADMAASFADAAKSFTATSKELSKINMTELAEVMTESSRALLVTAEGINSIMEELEEITKKSKRMFDRLEQKVIDGNLFKVF